MVEQPKPRLSSLEDQACAGSAAAFGELIRSLDDDMRGVVYNVVRSVDAVDDVMQKAYEKAFKSIKSFKQGSSMKTWLYSICYRTAIDHLRYEKIRRHSDIEDNFDASRESASAATPEEDVVNKAMCHEMLQELEPETRAMLVLTSGFGLSFDETAEVVGVERGTVASRVSRAKAKLRSKRDAYNDGSRS